MTTKPLTLEQAIEAAARLHAGQVDKGGQPYILHPLRVMLAMETERERIAAVLHDVVEDCGWGSLTAEVGPLESWLDDALNALTRHHGESYEAFIERCARKDLARRVKLADLRDNLDLSRIQDPTDEDRRRWAKYTRAQAYLMGVRVRPAPLSGEG